jgi:hypothetical protein
MAIIAKAANKPFYALVERLAGFHSFIHLSWADAFTFSATSSIGCFHFPCTICQPTTQAYSPFPVEKGNLRPFHLPHRKTPTDHFLPPLLFSLLRQA